MQKKITNGGGGVDTSSHIRKESGLIQNGVRDILSSR